MVIYLKIVQRRGWRERTYLAAPASHTIFLPQNGARLLAWPRLVRLKFHPHGILAVERESGITWNCQPPLHVDLTIEVDVGFICAFLLMYPRSPFYNPCTLQEAYYMH